MKTLILVAALFSSVAYAQSPELNPAQKKAVAEMAFETNQGCIKAAKEVATSKIPPGFPEWAKIVMRSTSDPDYCPCIQRKLVESVTPGFFQLSQKQKQLHVLDVLQDQECGIASTKKVFSQSCESFVEASVDADPKGVKLNKLARQNGYPDTRSLTSGICACMQEKLRPITGKQWIERTKAAFGPGSDGKGSGPQNQIGKTPIEQAFSECIL